MWTLFFIYRNIAINRYMGLTKTEEFSEKQNELSLMMKALGHPARIAIIEILLKTENCICGDIVDELPLAQPTVSQHLKELKNAGLIKGNVDGTSICYCLDEKTWSKLQKSMNQLFEKIEQKKSCC
jgi:ArsR family transcriptional regulator, arsenate/arsenite/antimonite-responsive transcriptional repressor